MKGYSEVIASQYKCTSKGWDGGQDRNVTMASQEAIILGNPKAYNLALTLRAVLEDLDSLCELMHKCWLLENIDTGVGQTEAWATSGL